MTRWAQKEASGSLATARDVDEVLGVAEDAGQRVLEVVADLSGELLQGAVGAFEFGACLIGGLQCLMKQCLVTVQVEDVDDHAGQFVQRATLRGGQMADLGVEDAEGAEDWSLGGA